MAPKRNRRTDHKVELLAPAGNLEKLHIAVHFGADAVYLSGRRFSLRSQADNFSQRELAEAVTFCHARGVKVYVACNAFTRNDDQEALEAFLDVLAPIRPDGIIVADPGVLDTVKRRLPGIAVHLSTQANTTNYNSALFWKRAGVTRINTARELTLAEIAQIASHSELEIEAFVHGAMCMAYSGRCLLSSYLAERDGNQGLCVQACRWKYALTEETRPGHYFPLEQDRSGSYLLSANDLCMIDHIPEMVSAGISAFKIEGRMKGIGYLGPVVKTYRAAIDRFYADPDSWQPENAWREELALVSHRSYSTGFYFSSGGTPASARTGGALQGGHLLIGKVVGDTLNGCTPVETRNKIKSGDRVTVLKPGKAAQPARVAGLLDLKGDPITTAQPGSRVAIRMNVNCHVNDLIRRPTC